MKMLWISKSLNYNLIAQIMEQSISQFLQILHLRLLIKGFRNRNINICTDTKITIDRIRIKVKILL